MKAGGRLSIDLAAIVANWRLLANMATGAECGAVVKADAYGLGIEEVVCALARAGCRSFFVALPVEGVRARSVASDATIYVLNGLMPGSAGDMLAANLRPVLGSPEEIAEWSALAVGSGRSSTAALQVDTGMNRLGLDPAWALEHRATLGFALGLLISHFVGSEVPLSPMTCRQIEDFARLRQAFPDVPASLANSSGIFLGRQAHHDLLRPGYALFGGNPTPGRPNPMRSVVALEGAVLQVRSVPAGSTCGYSAQWTAARPSRLATIGLGYADGLPGNAWSKPDRPGAEAVVAGRRCPIAGRVSMDLTVIDVTDLPEDAVRRGDTVALLDDSLGIDELGARAGTSGYEILTALGRRYERRYVTAVD